MCGVGRLRIGSGQLHASTQSFPEPCILEARDPQASGSAQAKSSSLAQASFLQLMGQSRRMFLFSRSLFAPLPPGVLADFPPSYSNPHRKPAPARGIGEARCGGNLEGCGHRATPRRILHPGPAPVLHAGPTAADRGQPPLHPYHSPPHPQPHALLRHCGLSGGPVKASSPCA